MSVQDPVLRPSTFHVHTYGCQMNMRDSEGFSALLAVRGYLPVLEEADADIVIVNTCSVRGKAEEKAIGKLRLLVSSRVETGRPHIVGAVGCMVQRMQEDLFRQVPGLDFGLGPRRESMMPEILDAVLEGKTPILDVAQGPQDSDRMGSLHLPGQPSAFVNILQGCSRRCAYCVVPSVRGEESSRDADGVLAEVRALADSGVREVTLLGQSVMNYGRSNPVWPVEHRSAMGFKEPFPRLLEAVCAVPGIRRVRFMSGHPSGCTEELARAMSELEPVCEHLHLPLQSGSDRILALMRRGYTADGFRRSVDAIRQKVPRLALSTDVIVGFPTETHADFEATRGLLDEIGFDNAFIFKYSPRPGTPAAEMKDDVPAAEKLQRNKILLLDQDRRVERYSQDYLGMEIEVLVEGPSRKNSTRWSGRSRTNRIVILGKDDSLRVGDLVRVHVERCSAQTLYGRGVQAVAESPAVESSLRRAQ